MQKFNSVSFGSYNLFIIKRRQQQQQEQQLWQKKDTKFLNDGDWTYLNKNKALFTKSV